ncbi:MAG: alpha/beta fold hydrolase [Myxococcales bacterium]|nr:alpha/beta fold hydrolase [Myxococcales bacterium]
MTGIAALLALGLGAAQIGGCGSGAHGAPGFEALGGAASSEGGSGGGTVTTTTTTATTGQGGAGGAPEPKLGPPYPIVLAHGFFGFEDFAGAGFLSYFYGIKDHLAAHGEPLVFTPAVDPFNDSTLRGAQLIAHIEEILAETGHAKVNLIGHSQGGIDARVVAHDRPDLVASVITLQTPHYGTPIADVALELVDDPNLAAVLDFLVQAVGAPLYDQVGEQTSLALALQQLSSPGMQAFNAAYPDMPGIYYASVAGRSDWHTGGSACQVSGSPDFISQFASELDPIDPLLDITEQVLDGGLTNPYPNDGLVRVVDARWGEFLGCLPADHLDMVGQILGDDPGLLNDWDYAQFYVDLVQHLRARGL